MAKNECDQHVNGVELGFVEESESFCLQSKQFHSKVGGRPAWLSQSGLPSPSELCCLKCGQPSAFLLQVYAPIPRQARSFHRTCFVFCCKNTACYSHNDSRCFKVYRSQLPRKNDFYSYDPPVEEEAADIHSTDSEILQLGSGVKLCRVCGCLGPKSCSRCHSANYCSREHQTVDWKAGHKKECSKNGVVGVSLLDHKFLFLEYEVVTEPEDLQLEADSDGQIEEEQLKESEPPASDVLESMDEKDLEAMAKHESKESKVFEKFKRRTAIEPEQVLRYCRMGRPLWVSDENVPKETDIPNCLCGAKRLFEFQIMPQLLNYLKVDSPDASIDWGTLVVYTCAESCDQGNKYTAEFILKQDYGADHI
ncbi:programmed cell death protein 2 isoform X1 [Acipenser ruthenus]|uniref:programmed cell death protein 2 isoform X1 n=1 Tax=Acipenser ruthenus TaxID=7906 RepID=UPI00145A53EF|nr:programmed cell death protein 2 isoform X1 [Acipenser ruthenus]